MWVTRWGTIIGAAAPQDAWAAPVGLASRLQADTRADLPHRQLWLAGTIKWLHDTLCCCPSQPACLTAAGSFCSVSSPPGGLRGAEGPTAREACMLQCHKGSSQRLRASPLPVSPTLLPEALQALTADQISSLRTACAHSTPGDLRGAGGPTAR